MLKVTCSVLCHNYGRFLGQAIESCLAQRPGDYELEVLVIDDGSTDETPEVCGRYGERIRVSRTANCGFGASLGRGLVEATGDYVCFLDADDYFHPDKVIAMLPYMERGDLYIMHRSRWVDDNCRPLDGEVHSGMTSTLCLRRATALQALPVPNELFFLVLDQPGRSARPPEPLTFYRVHAASMQRQPQRGLWHEQLSRINRDFVARLDCLIADPPEWVTSIDRLRELRDESRLRAAHTALEAALERGQRKLAFRRCWHLSRQVYEHFRSVRRLPYRMIARTLLGLPTYMTRPGRRDRSPAAGA